MEETVGPLVLNAEEGTLMGRCIDKVFLHLNCEVRKARAREMMEQNLSHGFPFHCISYRKLQHSLF